MKNNPKPDLQKKVKSLKIALAIEVACLGGLYYYSRALRNSQDKRWQYHQDCPQILEVYYQIDDFIVKDGTRALDKEAWKNKK